jgi:hypothetical protein
LPSRVATGLRTKLFSSPDLAVVWLESGASSAVLRYWECRPRFLARRVRKDDAMTVMIGVDPHTASHTAVVVDGGEVELAAIRVRSSSRQVGELLVWAGEFGDRTGVVESAGGVGYLLARQLVAAGERVVDVPATLPARARLLGSGRSNKNDPNDAYSVAVAALRQPALPAVAPADHAAVLRVLAKPTSSSVVNGRVRRAGCTRWWSSWCRAESARKSRLIAPRGCWRASRRPMRWN